MDLMSHRSDHGPGGRVYNPGMHPPRPRLKLLLRALVICWLLCETAIWFGIRYLGYRLTGRSLADRQALFGQSVLSLFRSSARRSSRSGRSCRRGPICCRRMSSRRCRGCKTMSVRSRLPTSSAPSKRTWASRSDELFREFSPQPIASASVAQVHRARLPSGQVSPSRSAVPISRSCAPLTCR
jgi:hypothetical protein